MKQIIICICLFVLANCVSIHSTAQGKGNNKKEQSAGKGNQKGQGQGNQKGQGQVKQNDNGNQKGQGQNKDKAGKKEQNNDKGKPGKTDVFDNSDGRGKGNNGNGNAKNIGKPNENVRKIVSTSGDYHYLWNRDNFNDRKKMKNAGKVTVCHKYGRGDEPPVTINISRNALDAHLRHGDVQGNCPVYRGNRRLSDIIFGRRTNYYNTLYDTQDEVVYSQSILDYALQRLTGARTELVTLQSNNAPVYVIEERQAVVNELEQNVSLLEVALAATAAILVSKLLF